MFKGASAILPASNMERAKAFYRDVLGLEPTDERPDGSADYEVGSTQFVLYPSEFAGTNKATAMGLETADLSAATAALQAKGVVFQEFEYGDMRTEAGVLTLPDGSKAAWFSDTEDNIIGLVQRV
jgi:predicted enzyme related to lactoylglutathione lyase